MKTPHTTMRFDSWDKFLDRAKQSNPSPYAISHRVKRSSGYYLTKSFDEAMDLAQHGWTEKGMMVEALTEKIKDDLRPKMVQTFGSFFDTSGGQVDMDRFLMGEPENMIELIPVKVAKPGRVISILVNMFFSAGTHVDDVVKRGTAIVGLIECLELLQHSTELWVEMAGSNVSYPRDEQTMSILVKVKGAEDKPDMGRIMFAISHPDMLRRLLFGVAETIPDCETRRVFGVYPEGSGYFYPNKLQCASEVAATLTIDHMKLDSDSEEWIKANLGEFGLLS